MGGRRMWEDSYAMPTDLTVVMRDQPGELARLGEVAVAAGVHLRGLAAFTGDGRGFVHVLVDDDDVTTAKHVLDRAIAAGLGTELRLRTGPPVWE